MEANLEKMERALETGATETFLDLDSAFHLAIAKATQNNVLFEMNKRLLEMADLHMWRSFKTNLGLFKTTLEGHRRILSAVKKRDPKRAEFYAETHLMHYVSEVIEKAN
jgi:GntR family transcriptional repressor for pyruvate dehydrogenase complex